MEQQLKGPTSDISKYILTGSNLSLLLAPKFLQALKDLGDVDEEAISEAHLRTEYGKLQEQVRSCVCVFGFS